MTSRASVASAKEIHPGDCRAVRFEGKEVGLFNVAGKFYAIDNLCPHRGGPLTDGRLEGKVVACPWHGWEFDVTTGELAMSPENRVARYDVEVRGDDIYISQVKP